MGKAMRIVPSIAYSPRPRCHLERATEGYRVVGDNFLLWEPTLKEAIDDREELETPGWRYPFVSSLRGSISPPLAPVVYGPLQSRRLERSIGVNFTPPGMRVCSFSCVYCEYALTGPEGLRGSWPTPEEIESALANILSRVGLLDSITISGHGEPTLHPRFPAVTAAVLEVARRSRSGTPVRILTNGSRVVRPEIRRALDLLDERIVKLDAAMERVNRPAPSVPFGALLHALSLLRDVTLQSCFVDGVVSNIDASSVRQWADMVSEIEPRRVQIYTIHHPPAGDFDIRPVTLAQLEEIACLLRARTGIEAAVYA